jgi:Na+-translocating ferredoxin:NAD+ oxidoreductase RnfA subunit
VDMGRLNVIHASAIGLGACAIAALVFPGALLRGLGVPDDSIAIMGVIRLSGVLLLALASVLWSARFWLLSPLGASTLRTLAVIYGIGAVMLIAQQMAASRLLESTVPILYMSLLAFEYAGTARRFSKRWGAPA